MYVDRYPLHAYQRLIATMATNEQTIPVPVGSEAIAELDEGESQVPVSSNTFPLAEGMSLSYWLQGVRSNPLLDHRSTGGIPAEADVVIIGSGVSLLVNLHTRVE